MQTKNKSVGEEIKHQRKKQGLTQKELASKANISEITLRKYEAEATEHTEKTLIKIAQALGIGEYYFLEYNKLQERKTMTDIKELYFTGEEIDKFREQADIVENCLTEIFKLFLKFFEEGGDPVCIALLKNMADAEEQIKELLYLFWRWFALRGIDENDWKTLKITDKKPVVSFEERLKTSQMMKFDVSEV